jgi:hypothetical protein
MRPASLALRTFSNSGTMVEFELAAKYSQGTQHDIHNKNKYKAYSRRSLSY